MTKWILRLLLLPVALPILNAGTAPVVMLGSHEAKYADDGSLIPWTSWSDTLDREMNWYLQCPVEHGYPRFVWMTFMDGEHQADPKRFDFIPSMQNGVGIISYLKYYNYTGRKNPKVVEFARYMGDYLVKESLTADYRQVPTIHPLYRHSGQVPRAGRFRVARRQAVRGTTRQRGHSRLCTSQTVRGNQRPALPRSGVAERPCACYQYAGRRCDSLAVAVSSRLPDRRGAR